MKNQEDIIKNLVLGTYTNRDGIFIKPHIKSIVITDTLSGIEHELIQDLGFKSPIAIVSDPETYQALGARVESALEKIGDIFPIHLNSQPHADAETASEITEKSNHANSIVAVGSGTINDLCKYCAMHCNIPYAVFATAPSMNGYTSTISAITIDGFKTSVSTVAPEGVFMDLEVLSSAPERMIHSGLGDSLCRPVCQTDWLMSHMLLGTFYDATPFDLLLPEEKNLFDNAEGLMDKDTNTMRALARILSLSGIGMTICGGSQPAAQGEHLISHFIEMMAPENTDKSFHGEQIAVTTLVMARLQDRLLKSTPPQLSATKITKNDVYQIMGSDLGPASWNEFSQKCIKEEQVDHLNERLEKIWDDLRDHAARNSISVQKLSEILNAAGAPVCYDDIGLDRDFFRSAIINSRFQRNRYTFLDLAADCGLLDPDGLM